LNKVIVILITKITSHNYLFKLQMSGGHGGMSNKIDKLLALFKDVQDRLDHLEGKQI